MLEIHNLHVATEEGKKILNGVNLRIGAGEVHAIMGPNGSGKSTLANVIAGREGYVVTEGSIAYDGRDLLEMEPDERACAGIFLAFQNRMKSVKMHDSFLSRAVNVGFSGGEKKRNEIMQMAVLEPRLAVLDETDSGLDIDALRVVSEGVNALRDAKRSFMVITHYQRLLEYIVPDYVHVLVNGEIVESGDKTLALQLEEKGYADFRGEETGAARSA